MCQNVGGNKITRLVPLREEDILWKDNVERIHTHTHGVFFRIKHFSCCLDCLVHLIKSRFFQVEARGFNRFNSSKLVSSDWRRQ